MEIAWVAAAAGLVAGAALGWVLARKSGQAGLKERAERAERALQEESARARAAVAAAQAEAAAMQLATPDRAPTLQEIGKTLGISAQAVNDRVRGAGCQAIASVLRRWEAAKRNQGWSGVP